MNEEPDDVKQFVDKLRTHSNVKECKLVRTRVRHYMYLVSFSDDCTRTGIENILSSMRESLSNKPSYKDGSVLQVYDDRSSDDISELDNIRLNERILVFDFN